MLRRLTLFVALALTLPGLAFAASPKLGYQGRLLRADGTAESGVVRITFGLYSAATGGTALWDEEQQLALSDGYYATLLGEQKAISESLFDDRDLFLDVSLSGTSMSPRQKLSSVPHAVRAASAVNVVGGKVEASELYVGGEKVIGSDGKLAGAAAYTAGSGLELKDGAFSLLTTCSAGQVLAWTDGAWKCAAAGAQYTAPAGGGLALDGTAFSLKSCAAGQLLKFDGSAWACAADSYTKTESDARYAAFGAAYSKTEADAKFAAASGVYTKTEADSKFAAAGAAYTKSEADAKYAVASGTYTKTEADSKFATAGAAYTKAEADARFALKDSGLPAGSMVISADPQDQTIVDAGFKQVGTSRTESYLQRANALVGLQRVHTAAVVNAGESRNFGTFVYVIGGNGATACLNNNQELDLTTGTWTAKAVMPTARYGHNVVAVGTKIYAIGGYCNTGGGKMVNEVYDSEANTWSTKAAPSNTSYGAAAVATADGLIHVIGGVDYGSGTTGSHTTAHRIYDIANNQWLGDKAPYPLTPGPRFPAFGLLPDGRIIVAGGGTGASGASNFRANTYIYNPANNTWATNIASLPTALEGAHGAVVAGKFHVFGGQYWNGTTTANGSYHYIYDPATNTWRAATAVPYSGPFPAVATLPGSALIIGGLTNQNVAWEYLAPLFLYQKQ